MSETDDTATTDSAGLETQVLWNSLLHVQDQFVRHGSVRLIQCESAE